MIDVLKLVLVPLLILAVTLAARRWGVAVGGMLAGLPILGGPILGFLAAERGNAFAAETAAMALLNLPTIMVSLLVYAWCALRWSWPLALLGMWLSYVAIGAGTLLLPVSWPLGVALGTAAVVVVPLCYPRTSAVRPPPSRWGELVLRMLAADLLLLGITGAAQAVGPAISGIATSFPIAGSVLAVFAHRAQGGAAAASLLRAVTVGLAGYGSFVAAFVQLAPRWSLSATLMGACAICLVVQALAILLHRKASVVARPVGADT